MKLPGRDYPMGPMTAEELEIDAARVVREAKAMKLGAHPDTRQRNRHKRATALYGALLAKTAATRMRKRGATHFSDLSDRDRRRVITDTDKHAKRGTHIEDIY